MKLIYIFSIFLFFGCASPKVITANDYGISVNIMNTGMTSSEMIRNGALVAEAHCAKFGKKANFENTSGVLGAPHVAHFTCR